MRTPEQIAIKLEAFDNAPNLHVVDLGGKVFGGAQVNFLAFSASKPHILGCGAFKVSESLDARQRGHATTRFLEGFLEGSLKEVLLRRFLEGALSGFQSGQVLRRVLRRGGVS